MEFGSYETKMGEKGLDAAWLQMRIATNNLANYSTPGYKAKQVSFREVFVDKLNKEQPFQRKFVGEVTYDEKTEARVDGNNVSMEKEQLDLWRAQAQYSYLVQKQAGFYSTMRDTIRNFGK